MSTFRASAGYRLLLSTPSAGLGIALTTQITALSWLLESRYNLAIDDIALVWAAGPLAGILGQVAAGHASDRSWIWGGRRRAYLLMSGVFSSLALLALPELGTVAAALGGLSIVLVAACVALLLDVAINVGLNPARALIADIVPAGPERSLTFAYMQTLSGATGVAITIVGAWLGNMWMIMIAAFLALPLTSIPAFLVREPREIAAPALAEKLNLKLLMAMLLPIAPAALFAVICSAAKIAGITIAVIPLALATAVATAVLAIPIFRTKRTDQVALARRILFAQGLSWIGIFAMFVFLAPVVAERLPHLDQEKVGRDIAISLGLFNLVAAIAPLAILMPLVARFRRAYVHAAAIMLMGLAFGAIGLLVQTKLQLWLCMAVAGIGWGSLVSLPYVIFCDRIDARQLGLLLGIFNLAVVIPQLVVSLGLGAIAPSLPARGDLFVIAAIALFAAALAWAMVPPLAKSDHQ